MPKIQRALDAILPIESAQTEDGPMIWITGPRQVGKTFLVRQKVKTYFNWDTIEVRKAFARDPYFFRGHPHQWVIFDEIHKRKDWKKLLKGYYDSPSRQENFIVTGSGRFDTFLRGGDSLQGRYDLFSLWPLMYDEIRSVQKIPRHEPRNFAEWEPQSSTVKDSELLEFGGFPTPFLQQSRRSLQKWMDLYLDRLVREDIRDFSAVEKVDKIDLLARLLSSRVMSPLSIKSLSEDVEVSPVAIKSWLRLFEILYFGFRIPPFHRKIHRAVKKEQKWYFYQWTFNEDPAARFENYLAVQLAAACAYWKEQGFGSYELTYLRDQDDREVDFLITRNLQPIALIEAKSSFQPWPKGLNYYAEKMRIPGFLVYPTGPVRKATNGWSLPSASFLHGLVSSS